jgi:ribosomal protein S18 acetylase RimI-like enzyme
VGSASRSLHSLAVTAKVTIEEVRAVTPELVEAFAHLVPQLSSTIPPDHTALRAVVDNEHTFLFIARDATGGIVGTTCLATFAIPTGVRAWIEDVVVDSATRGGGIGTALVTAALERARQLGARSVDLTSRPNREEANRLYTRIGFARRSTNVYRYALDA